MEKFSTIELFAGAGGMALGFEQAGFEHLMLVENDKDAGATLKLNRPNWPVFNDDIAKADYTGLKPDVVTGGWPCQSFSHVGKRLGFEDTRGTLFYEFARCIRTTRPKIFIGENVYGLLTHNGGQTYKVIMDVFSELGYKLEGRVLNSKDYGVPQSRKRIIIVGIEEGWGKSFIWPKKEDKIVSLKEALKNCPVSVGTKYSEAKRKVMEMVPPGKNWKSLPEEVAKAYMKKGYYNGGGRTSCARRLSWDAPCLTILCSPAQMQTERCHPDETRPLTVRESARVQTFPDDWFFTGGVTSQYKQIGNAVPVELARRLGESVKESLKTELETEGLFSI